MGHTAWAIMMFVTLMVYLAMIPSDIRKEKYTSAGFNIIMAIFSAMFMEYEYLSSAEIESKALAVHTVLVKNYNIVPKQLRGTIIPVLGTSSAPRNKIVITYRVPDDAPVPLIRDALIQKFGGNCTFFG